SFLLRGWWRERGHRASPLPRESRKEGCGKHQSSGSRSACLWAPARQCSRRVSEAEEPDLPQLSSRCHCSRPARLPPGKPFLRREKPAKSPTLPIRSSFSRFRYSLCSAACDLRIADGLQTVSRNPGHVHFCELVWSNPARSPLASFTASSLAQKCMKKSLGCSSSMWLCSAVTAMPLLRSVLITGLTSAPIRTKSPVMAAFPPPVG